MRRDDLSELRRVGARGGVAMKKLILLAAAILGASVLAAWLAGEKKYGGRFL